MTGSPCHLWSKSFLYSLKVNEAMQVKLALDPVLTNLKELIGGVKGGSMAMGWLMAPGCSQHLTGPAHEGGASGILACSQILEREISKGFLTQMNYLKAMREFAGGIAGQLGIIFVKLWRMESCQEARERLMSSFPQRRKKVEFRNQWPLNFMLILTKKCRLQDFNDEVKHFKGCDDHKN